MIDHKTHMLYADAQVTGRLQLGNLCGSLSDRWTTAPSLVTCARCKEIDDAKAVVAFIQGKKPSHRTRRPPSRFP